MATQFNCSGEAAAHKAAGGDAAPEIIVRDSQTLGELTDVQLDHVSLGLEYSFGCQLERCGSGFDMLYDGEVKVLLAGSHTIMDAWQIAQSIDA